MKRKKADGSLLSVTNLFQQRALNSTLPTLKTTVLLSGKL